VRYLIAFVVSLCIAGGAQALAGNPSVPDAGPAASIASPPTPAKAAAESPQANSSPPSPTVVVTAAQDKKWRSQGYKPVVRNGETLYCRREPILGSHFATSACRTAASLEDAERSGQYYVEQNQHVGVQLKK
jgi:hypothetical protein